MSKVLYMSFSTVCNWLQVILSKNDRNITILMAIICKLNIMKEEQSIGMMEGAFFVPKSDLLAWVNTTLKL